ncbi:hypothetical protein [Kaistella antarctica]|uniref:Outer membrane protein beta-barrel domain-containing protein n=1 Tax=Kaistella antarctica TaxID=266748 RepID=A0A3S4YPR5_9FLAO|nr:hypothetical protein [Kaistella antarctica]KEY19967.1 hypothetical protein HY04_01720 [Kaistella antarctica]SEV95311.1 hypothetical protein SAMN05421765_1426 [Kaistella antarctica]VEH95926.1 Uncharacterised protein [Kaistella antarctica]
MKKLLITGAVALMAMSANAQLQKGNYMVGGEFAAANFGLNQGAGYNFQITPQAAFFVQDNWAVGPYVKLGFSGAKGSPTTFGYGVGALSRYYFSPGEQGIDSLLKHGRFFVEGNAGIGGTTISDGGASANGLDLGIGPGYTYFITQNIGLDASVKLNGNLGFGNRGTTSAIDFRLGLNIFLPSRKAMSNIKTE